MLADLVLSSAEGYQCTALGEVTFCKSTVKTSFNCAYSRLPNTKAVYPNPVVSLIIEGIFRVESAGVSAYTES